MIFPPSIMRVRILEGGRRRRNLWLPLLLLWPIVTVAGLAGLPVLFVLMAVRPRMPWRVLLALPWAFLVFCRFRGLRVELTGPKKQVSVWVV
jgi:hypothetical protein